jgi:hypothetical protein
LAVELPALDGAASILADSLNIACDCRTLNIDEAFLGAFLEDWRRQRGDAPLGRVAIVDDAPASQYLYPEFPLFRQLFRRSGAPASRR